jgi:hypothetical protein
MAYLMLQSFLNGLGPSIWLPAIKTLVSHNGHAGVNSEGKQNLYGSELRTTIEQTFYDFAKQEDLRRDSTFGLDGSKSVLALIANDR